MESKHRYALIGVLVGMLLTIMVSALREDKKTLRFEYPRVRDSDSGLGVGVESDEGSFTNSDDDIDNSGDDIIDPNALPDSEVFTHEDVDNHGPVVTYPPPSRVTTATNWETNENIEFKVFKQQTCGVREGTVLGEHPREYALRRCATWQLCQSVVCDERDMCILRSPTCDLSANGTATAYVIVERTARDIPLWHYLVKNLKPMSELRRGRNSSAKEFLTGACTYRFPHWAGQTRRESTEYPFIEVSKKDKKALDAQVMIDPIHKLVFFRVAKVMSTNLFVLYDRLLGHKDILADTNLTLPLHNLPVTKLRKRMYLKELSQTQAKQIMNDPSWKKIVFFRDPAERFLSFYLNKMKKSPVVCAYFKRACEDVEFKDQVSFVARTGPRPYGNGPAVDRHYRQQFLLSNMYKFITQMDFIAWGTSESAELMLRKYGLWEKHGAPELWPYGFMRNGGSHATGSENKFQKYYTDQLLKTVKKAYNLDYTFLEYVGLTNESSPPVNGLHVKPHNSRCCNSGCIPVGNSVGT